MYSSVALVGPSSGLRLRSASKSCFERYQSPERYASNAVV